MHKYIQRQLQQYLDSALNEAGPLGVGAELVDELLHVRLLGGRGLVRAPLVLGHLRPNVHERVVVPLVVVQLLRQEVDDVRRNLCRGEKTTWRTRNSTS